MLNFTIESLPEEVLVNILSDLPLSSLVNMSEVDRLFARISQTNSIWQNMIRRSFAHLRQSNPIAYQNRPKKLFIEEYLKWQMFSGLTKIDLSLIFSAMANDMSSITQAQALTDEQRTLLVVLNAAATGEQNPTLTTQQDQKFYAAFVKHFNRNIASNQRTTCMQGVSENMREPLHHLYQMDEIEFSIQKFVSFFREVAIARTEDAKSAAESVSLFDKLSYLTTTEIELLEEAIQELCFMMCNRADLTSAQAAILSKCDFSEQQRETIVALFNEQFGENVLDSSVNYVGRAFTSYHQLILHLCENVFTDFGDIILEKSKRELAQRKQAAIVPAVTPQFANTTSANKRKRSEENETSSNSYEPTSPTL